MLAWRGLVLTIFVTLLSLSAYSKDFCLENLNGNGLDYDLYSELEGYPTACGWNQWRNAHDYWDIVLNPKPAPLEESCKVKPIFVLGCGHTGTTWFISMLNRHPNIYAPPEETRMFNRKDQDVYTTQAGIERRMKLQGENKRRWAEKTPAHVCNLGQILSYYPCARIVFMIRDPRDVYISLAKRYSFAYARKRTWNDNQAGLLFASDPRVLVFKYEDLVSNPQAALDHVFEHLQETFSPDMLPLLLGEKDAEEARKEREQLNSLLQPEDGKGLNKVHDRIRTLQRNLPLYTNSLQRWKRDMTMEGKEVWKNRGRKGTEKPDMDRLISALCYEREGF